MIVTWTGTWKNQYGSVVVISGEEGGPDDLFPPLVLDYAPTPDSSLRLAPPPAAPRHFQPRVPE